ncbi:hypothetical protein OIU80_11020 [Flavobacterium sp. LS1R47]|uniref:Cell wall anchor protein n=1 Tax=Flavobacterium frigoritolerans TaxID=2987686 RepID=A0A9X3C180_9FLAO|nr:hypothetical protein [Flavobacterium frigoritolerans]MCV9932815.1 hypothetical protein [Flavobacterium frigoritolerans]
MKKRITLIALLFISSYAFSQQIGDGFAPLYTPDFTAPLKSGVYGGFNAIGSNPDLSYSGQQHLFVIRHTSQVNNHQLQISSSFITNDRLFFRKIANNLVASNPGWIEIATRGDNTFEGSQNINGNLDIFNYTNKITGFGDPNNYYIGSFPVAGSAGLDIHYYGGIRFGDYTSNSVMQIADGNVGIGTINPKNKLDVNGTIHSKEVKVDLLGWSDFVFKKEYNLPTLEEVEKHINEKGHLENIPSEEEVLKNGINLGEMNAKLLQKIEELTLYSIQQSKEIQTLKEENKSFKTLSERLSKIEQQLK